LVPVTGLIALLRGDRHRDVRPPRRASGKRRPGCAPPRLGASEARLAAEVEALGRLHALSARLVGAPAPAALLAEVLEGTMALQGAALGNIQLYDPATRTLSIAVQRGFAAPFLARFGTVDAADPTACGRALAGGQRVVIEDVEADPAYAPLRAVAAAAGYRAVQSTPLFGGDGRPVGMLSTHFPRPHRPSDRELRLTDLYMGLAVQLLERAQLATERERRAVAEAVAAERQALLARVVAAQEEERRRVAHEVHDGVTQLAHAAALRLDALAERLAAGGAPDAADLADLARARDLTRRAAADARRLIAGLRPEALDALGLAEAVRQEVAVLRAEGWRADVADGAPAPGRLPPEAEIALFRVAQEALTNVRKHTGPGVRVRVRLAAAGGLVRLTVQDWGRGFAPAPPGAAGEHVGLVGMRERLALLGGALTVRSAPGRGTTVRATLPLPPPAGGAGAGRSS
jgi:signal transduction histidine kinase